MLPHINLVFTLLPQQSVSNLVSRHKCEIHLSDLAESHLCEVMCLSFPLITWWHFALEQQPDPHHPKSKYYCGDSSKCAHYHQLRNGTIILRKGNSNEPDAMVVLPKHCNNKKVIKYRIIESEDSYRICQQLLMQAGDVETNPGPGIVM